jgi:hypothetical protein
MDPDLNDIDSTLASLRAKVSSFASTGAGGASIGNLMPKIGLKKSYICYIAVPAVILIGLMVLKPAFVTTEVPGEEDIPVITVSGKKVMVTTVVFSVIIYACIYFAGTRRSTG